MAYLKDLEAAKNDAVEFLRSKGVDERYLEFVREAPVPARQPRVPTDARSEFLANRAMGDWAENTLADALRKATGKHVVHYGESDRIGAGEDGFAEFYRGRSDDVRRWGKRPDLLIFDDEACEADISSKRTDELVTLAKAAISSVEVRSSKTEALRYIAVRESEGRRGARACPSFTVKVEDLIIVYRWLLHHKVPQFYAQVFFDSVYIMSVLDIFRALRDRNGITIEQNPNNQLKSTIHLPISMGLQLGVFTSLPGFTARDRITRLGRHDAYVEPVGGNLEIDPTAAKASGMLG